MQKIDVTVDFNGIVVFDPVLLNDFYGEIDNAVNLYQRFVKID